jgi:hypothetical protein
MRNARTLRNAHATAVRVFVEDVNDRTRVVAHYTELREAIDTLSLFFFVSLFFVFDLESVRTVVRVTVLVHLQLFATPRTPRIAESE